MSTLHNLGDGIVSVDPTRPLGVALKKPSTWTKLEGGYERVSIQLVTSRDTVEKLVSANSGGDGMFNGILLSGGSSFLRHTRVTHYDAFMVVSIEVRTGGKTFPAFALNSVASKALDDDPGNFARAYGDMFCAQIEYGGTLHLVFQFHSDGRLYTNVIESEISASALDWGAYGDFKSRISYFSKYTNCSIGWYSEGPPFVVTPNPTVKQVIKAVDNFAKAARRNVTIPAIHYFAPYSVTNPKSIPPEINLNKLRSLRRAEEDLLDAESEYLKALTDRNEFLPFDESTVRDALTKIRVTKRDIEDVKSSVLQDPFDDSYEIPSADLPPIPTLNLYSEYSVYRGLSEGRAVIVTLTNGSVGPVKQGTPHLTFFKTGVWYSYTGDSTQIKPGTRKTNVRGFLWIWGNQFTYDNSRIVRSTRLNVTGILAFADEITSLIELSEDLYRAQAELDDPPRRALVDESS